MLVVEFTDFEGYVNFTSSLKKSKGNVDFVEVNINCEINTNHGISYDINRLPLYLKKTLKGYYMLNAEVSMENVIITDNTVIKPKDVIFENVKHEPSAVTMIEHNSKQMSGLFKSNSFHQTVQHLTDSFKH